VLSHPFVARHFLYQEVKAAANEFRIAIEAFKDAYADYKKRVGGSRNPQMRISMDSPLSESWSENAPNQERVRRFSDQLIETENVDDIMAEENRQDTIQLADDAVILKETMLDLNKMIEKDGEILQDIEQVRICSWLQPCLLLRVLVVLVVNVEFG